MAYCSYLHGPSVTALQHNVGASSLRKWIAVYQVHEIAGIRVKRREFYDVEFKRAVLQQVHVEALSFRQAAALFDIRNLNIIGLWQRAYESYAIAGLVPCLVVRHETMAKEKIPPSAPQPCDDEPRSRHKALQAGDKYADVKARIRAVYDQHKGRYGYRRITAMLKRQSSLINHKTVQQLMDQLQLKSLVRVKKYRVFKGQMGRVAPNILARDFAAAQPNEKWVTDVTEFNVGGAKLYLSPIMDLYNGEIVAYETAKRPLLNMVEKMLMSAFKRLGSSDKPILHSDQGWQYRMPQYRRCLDSRAITQSVSRKGNCHDNASMESFFGTLKSEFFYLNTFSSIEELQVGIDEYIEYYNQNRIKLKLDGLSPIDYRMRFSSN